MLCWCVLVADSNSPKYRAIQSHLLTGVIISNNEPAVVCLVVLAHFFFSEFFLWDLRCHGYDCCLVAFDDIIGQSALVGTMVTVNNIANCLLAFLFAARAWQVAILELPT